MPWPPLSGTPARSGTACPAPGPASEPAAGIAPERPAPGPDSLPAEQLLREVEPRVPIRRDREMLFWKLRYPTIPAREAAARLDPASGQFQPPLYLYHKQAVPIHNLAELAALHQLTLETPTEDATVVAIRSLCARGMTCYTQQAQTSQECGIHPLALHRQLLGGRSDVYVKGPNFAARPTSREELLALDFFYGSGKSEGLSRPELARSLAATGKDYSFHLPKEGYENYFVYGAYMDAYLTYIALLKDPDTELWASRRSEVQPKDEFDYSWDGIPYCFPMSVELLDRPEQLAERADLVKHLGEQLEEWERSNYHQPGWGGGWGRVRLPRIARAACQPGHGLPPRAAADLLFLLVRAGGERAPGNRQAELDEMLAGVTRELRGCAEVAEAVPDLLKLLGGPQDLQRHLHLLAQRVGQESGGDRVAVLKEVLAARSGGKPEDAMLAYVKTACQRFGGDGAARAEQRLTALLLSPALFDKPTPQAPTGIKQEADHCLIGGTRIRRRGASPGEAGLSGEAPVLSRDLSGDAPDLNRKAPDLNRDGPGPAPAETRR